MNEEIIDKEYPQTIVTDIKTNINNSQWLDVYPIHCHQRLAENTLITKVRAISANECEAIMKFVPEELNFFYDHKIDHLPGMLEACSIRQCALAVGHLIYGIPMKYQTVLGWMNLNLHNFGELNIETRCKVILVNQKVTKNKIELALKLLLLQGDYPLMKTEGNLIAFSPDFFAKKVRARKITLEKILMKEKSKIYNPSIVEIHILVNPSYWEQTSFDIFKAMKDYNGDKNSFCPLYLNYDEEDYEIRCCCTFLDPRTIEENITNKIRPIKGVLATKVRLTLNGKIFPEGVSTLISDDNYASAHIFLKIEPSKDIEVWNYLCFLPNTLEAFPTWIFRDFYEYDRDITLRVVGLNKGKVEEYINKNVSTIKGISQFKTKFMKKFIKIQDKNILSKLAQNWMKQ